MRRQSGFTLVELLAVMAIIGILAGVTAGAVTGLGGQGINAQISSDANAIGSAADRFLNASFPETYPVSALPSGEADLGVREINFYARVPQDPAKTFVPDFLKKIPNSAPLVSYRIEKATGSVFTAADGAAFAPPPGSRLNVTVANESGGSATDLTFDLTMRKNRAATEILKVQIPAGYSIGGQSLPSGFAVGQLTIRFATDNPWLSGQVLELVDIPVEATGEADEWNVEVDYALAASTGGTAKAGVLLNPTNTTGTAPKLTHTISIAQPTTETPGTFTLTLARPTVDEVAHNRASETWTLTIFDRTGGESLVTNPSVKKVYRWLAEEQSTIQLDNVFEKVAGKQAVVITFNSRPLAEAQTVVTNEDSSESILLTGSDPDGDPLTFTIETQPSHGSLSGTAPNLNYTPDPNFQGSDSFTFSVDDGIVASRLATVSISVSTGTVSITVNSINDAPSFTIGQTQTILEDAGAQTVTGWATAISPGPDDEAGQSLIFLVSNDNNALFAVQPAVAANGTLTYTPTPDANGAASVSVQLRDNGGTDNGGVDTSAPQSFTITVDAVNDAPSFTVGLDQIVNEDSGPQSVTGWATNISAGADNQAQGLTFNLGTNVLFSVQPAVSSTGNLTYTPAPDANGSATITVELQDNGTGSPKSAPQSFTITVDAVNDAPSFTVGLDQIVNEDSGPQSVTGWATNIDAGADNESGQTLTFFVTGNDNVPLFSTEPAVTANGTLTYIPATATTGSATITLHIEDDGGTANTGEDTGTDKSFTITIDPLVLLNGSFEDGLISWTSVDIDLINTTFWTASDGSQSIDLNGSGPGTISQSIDTVDGSQYQVRFDMAGNPHAPDQKTVTMTVSAAGQSSGYSFSTVGKSESNMGWEERSFFFTASFSTATLTFESSTNTGNLAVGPALDNVRVNRVN